MKFFNFFNRKAEAKENPVGAALIPGYGQKLGGAKEGIALIKDGYQRNAIVYRAIEVVSKAGAALKLDVKVGEDYVEDHPLLALLKRPNPTQGYSSFMKENIANILLMGEATITKSGTMGDKAPKELWNVRPLDVKIMPGKFGLPTAYIHERNNVATPFPVDQVTGFSDMFFFKLYNPDDPWRGQPPIRAAALAADAHNEGLNWNYNLLRKGARLSGFISAPGGYPDSSIIAKLKEFFSKHFQGSDNAGEVLILSGGAEYKPFEATAKDMDFIQGMKEYAKLVSSCFGVPLPLIDNDAASMNNMEQSKETLYTDTVIPLVEMLLDALNPWFSLCYGQEIKVCIDMDAIPALEALRARKTERTAKAKDGGLITTNEARDEIGYDDYKPGADNADKIFINGGLMPLDMADVAYDPTEADPAKPGDDPEDEEVDPDKKPKEDEVVKPAK